MDVNTKIGLAVGIAIGFILSIVLFQTKSVNEARQADVTSAAPYGSR